MKYITNAFSINMLATFPAQPVIEEITLEVARLALTSASYGGGAFACVALRDDVGCAVGHANTAALIDEALGLYAAHEPDYRYQEHPGAVSTTYGRVTVSLAAGDTLYVAQYVGPRLPEGVTTLPEGASIRWFRVTLPAA